MSNCAIPRITADELRALADRLGLTFRPDVIVERAAEAINREFSGYLFDLGQHHERTRKTAPDPRLLRLNAWAGEGLTLLHEIDATVEPLDEALQMLSATGAIRRLESALRKIVASSNSVHSEPARRGRPRSEVRQHFVRILADLFVRAHADAKISVSTRQGGERYGLSLNWCRAVISVAARPCPPGSAPNAALVELERWAARSNALPEVLRTISADEKAFLATRNKVVVGRRSRTITAREPIRRSPF